MINCESCKEYANRVLENGDIKAEELEDLIKNRHILKGCVEFTTFDIDKMELSQIKDVLKMIVRLMNHEIDRITVLQERVLKLESGTFTNDGTKTRTI